MIKLKNTIVFKRENENSGYVFSIGDDSSKLLKVSGLVASISEQLCNGTDIHKLITQILDEYEVDEMTLKSDLEMLKDQLKELEFLDI